MNPPDSFIRRLSLPLSLCLLAAACDGGTQVGTKNDEKVEAKAEAAKPEAPEPEEPQEPQEPQEPDVEAPKLDVAGAGEPPETLEGEDAEGEVEAANGPKPATKPKKAAPKPKTEPQPDEDSEPEATGASGKEIYAKKCKSCHGTTGAADTKIAQKHDIGSWKEPGWKAKWSQSKVEDIVRNGKSGTKMKAFEDKLTAEQIVAVSTYARSLGN